MLHVTVTGNVQGSTWSDALRGGGWGELRRRNPHRAEGALIVSIFVTAVEINFQAQARADNGRD